MSGIVGIVHLDGKPVDPRVLGRMTDFLAFRGPDAQETWSDGNVGFGHTMLRTTWEAEQERQPCSLDGRVWITADARIDDRDNLVEKLTAKGRLASLTRPDVELILHAYHVWGEDCVEHLLGDFAFAIWDSKSKHLFCARDHLGVKPLFYFHGGSTFVFSNTLNCVRQYPKVTTRLNDSAIADFLLFELNQNLATTTFVDIQRLPPANTMMVSTDGLRTRRYWLLPIDEPIYYKTSSDYTDHFKDLLMRAVRDRMRTPRVGVFMSGGIDSPTLAATACQLSDGVSDVAAFTSVFDELIPDDERYYSGLVASQIGIPIRYRVLDGEMCRPWPAFWVSSTEPRSRWLPIEAEQAYYRQLRDYGRVFLYGEGPDDALRYEWHSHLAYLVRRGMWNRLIADVSRHVITHRRIPLIPSIGRILADRAASKSYKPRFPKWLNERFVSSLELRAKWQAGTESPASNHPVRTRGYGSFVTPLWQELFTCCDAEPTGSPLEFRHPYVDLRLLRYMLAVPTLPWCREKHLLRRSMQGILPPQVLRRRKSPLASNPLFEMARIRSVTPGDLTEELLEYINPDKIDLTTSNGVHDFWLNLRPLFLNGWFGTTVSYTSA
jgi:asparagine synthase (glutamine-hydrolysing)